MKFLEDGTYMIRFGKLYRVEFPKSFLDDCNKVEIPNWKAIPVTNAQKIRSMTDEELVKQFASADGFCCPIKGVDCSLEPDCRVCFARWLKQEVKE